MATEGSRPPGPVYEVSLSLRDLVRRSQADFEIDFFEQLLSRDGDNIEVLRSLADLFAERGLHRRALQMDSRLAELLPRNAVVLFNLACSQSCVGEPLLALATLDSAVQAGFQDWFAIENDSELECVRKLPHFAALWQGWVAAPESALGASQKPRD